MGNFQRGIFREGEFFFLGDVGNLPRGTLYIQFFEMCSSVCLSLACDSSDDTFVNYLQMRLKNEKLALIYNKFNICIHEMKSCGNCTKVILIFDKPRYS